MDHDSAADETYQVMFPIFMRGFKGLQIVSHARLQTCVSLSSYIKYRKVNPSSVPSHRVFFSCEHIYVLILHPKRVVSYFDPIHPRHYRVYTRASCKISHVYLAWEY